MKKVLKYLFMIGYVALYLLFIYYFKINDFANALSIYILLYFITTRLSARDIKNTNKVVEYKLDCVYKKLLEIEEKVKQ